MGKALIGGRRNTIGLRGDQVRG